jgi:hypothetical protein
MNSLQTILNKAKLSQEDIYSHALALRRAFEIYQLTYFGNTVLSRFPEDCCAWATIGLAIHLHENCGLPKARISGAFAGEHAWLIIDDKLCVDITADQYVEILERVLVQPLHKWHSRFSIENILDYDKTVKTAVGGKEEYVYPVFRKLPSCYDLQR